ncbi:MULTISPECIES: DsbA family protein [Actinoalloteichus]|uniref:Protein-disulfide isomerase n=1 Tax=Actinoalloteichus fjordicus TaxID=1612552 RepID=A0AAC9L925_9PSEU|nr:MULTISPECIES: thioredoxin domain-containing protein [Actinoalloteichus]APU13076.1 protein-disulfide isomerase [Actinoalloteichus fjordicus]APU19049.1 protein-disulfide isomerase [Actinoalloteichus sp. GBA129-24]
MIDARRDDEASSIQARSSGAGFPPATILRTVGVPDLAAGCRKDVNVGGAERSARKYRQQQTQAAAAKAMKSAKGGGGKNTVVIGVVVVVVVAIAVIGGVLLTQDREEQQAADTISAVRLGDHPVAREGGSVLVGQEDAGVTIDIYEDFLCPGCAQFEEVYGEEIDEALSEGTVQINYHMLPMLNESNSAPGYSMRSANAALCAADQDVFVDFHASLFAAQPASGSTVWNADQLIDLGEELGVDDPAFATCVRDGEHNALVADELITADATEHLQNEEGRFHGTPLIAVGRERFDYADSQWLENAIATGS